MRVLLISIITHKAVYSAFAYDSGFTTLTLTYTTTRMIGYDSARHLTVNSHVTLTVTCSVTVCNSDCDLVCDSEKGRDILLKILTFTFSEFRFPKSIWLQSSVNTMDIIYHLHVILLQVN